ncbi:diguanylate cyclase [Marinobacter mobilis]|uniref:diguanylate cyclase n=1 Tax=Marinobacter mobilis TaxID=488533 RepID=A0A1H2PYA6_9GAMM|nr:diguanylate cyclase [Marinobacter mobilis]SDV99872.1 diguanylate cyclase (GGDEF) domain-containing protein [Marinobacter mobilis]
MSNGGYQDVVAKLETLKSQFVARVIAELDLNIGRLRTAGPDEPGLAIVRDGHDWLHRLAGSAGTFGFTAFGETARALELCLQPVVDSERADQQAMLAQVLDVNFFTRLDSLKSLLAADAGDSAIPVLQNSVTATVPEALLRVDLLEPDPALSRELADSLSRYGYEVVAFDSVPAFLASNPSGGITTIIANIELQDELQPVFDHQRQLHRELVIYLSRDDSFDVRYCAAVTGAGGFFPLPVDVPALADRIEQLSQEWEESAGGRVMVVEDDEELAEHYRLVLDQGGLSVSTITRPAEVMTQLAEFRPDILLMDINMAPYSGVSLARMVRFQPEWLGLPIVYLSSEQNRDTQISAVAQGGDDFIEKPISDERLVSVVKARCVRARQLAKLASRDSLTGLMKHSLIKQELAKEYSRCQRYSQVAAVAMLDLDHFKSVNDTYGHATGDTVIRSLANLLRHRLRKSDIIGRYGGEEFVVILPDCDEVQAERILQDVCDQFSGLVFSSQNTEFEVTLSAGIAILGEFGSAEAALNAADEAMYHRKNHGRNGVTLYSSMRQTGAGEGVASG